jgi:cell division protein FtsB
LKYEKEKRSMDEHGINLERSKLQYDKINSNVKRIVEENSKISARITELEKRMVLFITNLGAAEERGR